MYCKKCGYKNKNNAKFCACCGEKLEKIKSNNAKKILIIITIIILVIIVIVFFVIIAKMLNKQNVYFSDNSENIASDGGEQGILVENKSKQSSSTEKTKTKVKGETAIVVDNVYSVDLKNQKQAEDLLREDSESQKEGTTEEKIQKIEQRIINNYKVKAVNFGEMDEETAEGIEKVVEYIYVNYPKSREKLSNISIGNMGISQGSVIAYFGPSLFIMTKDSSGYPMSYKTLICMNSRYFLNVPYLKQSINESSQAGHFPVNSNEYSTVIHESAHFLNCVVLMEKYGIDNLDYIEIKDSNKYEQFLKDWCECREAYNMINEAYENYKQKYNDNTMTFDEFRASISGYAMAKDDNGKYIYDETIAEAFHDYYLNGENAAKASIEITKVLNERLK